MRWWQREVWKIVVRVLNGSHCNRLSFCAGAELLMVNMAFVNAYL